MCAKDIKIFFFQIESNHGAGNERIVSDVSVVIHTWLFAA